MAIFSENALNGSFYLIAGWTTSGRSLQCDRVYYLVAEVRPALHRIKPG